LNDLEIDSFPVIIKQNLRRCSIYPNFIMYIQYLFNIQVILWSFRAGVDYNN